MRTSFRMAFVVMALVLVGASVAQAASTLYTASVFRFGRTFDCAVVNTGSRAVTMTIQSVDFSGAVAGHSDDVVIQPGATYTLSSSPGLGTAVMYCKFIVTVGNKTLLRASYCIEDASSACAASGDAR